MGPERFATDRLYRLMKYRGSREDDLASYHPEAEKIFASFASGVNAFIESREDNLPVEFAITGTRPGDDFDATAHVNHDSSNFSKSRINF